MLRRYEHPGKFEGELLIATAVYQASLDSADDESGDYSSGETHCSLLRGLTDIAPTEETGPFTDEESALLAASAGAILEETSDGFVTVTFFSDAERMESTWADILAIDSESDDSRAS